MFRFVPYSIFALLLISQLHLCNSEALTLVAIGVISGVMGIIDFIWNKIDKINEVPGEKYETLSIYDLKKQLDLMTAEIIKAVNDANRVQTLKDRLHEATDAIDQIDECFIEMVHYNKTFDRDNPNTIIVATAEKRLLNGPDGPRFYLRKIHKLFYYPSDENILQILADLKKGYAGTCSSNLSLQSVQQIYQKFYLWTVISAAKTYLIIAMAANITKPTNADPDLDTVEFAKERILEKDKEATDLLKQYMKVASREVWRCDPDKQIEDVTYVQLHKLFQKYIIQEHDLGVEKNYCSGSCASTGNPATTNRCLNDVHHEVVDPDVVNFDAIYTKNATLCQNQRKCSGGLWDCENFGIEYRLIAFSDFLDICNSDQNSNRRYDFAQKTYGDGGEVTDHWGRKENCKGFTSKTAPHLQFTSQCEVCICTCAEDTSVDPDEYVSLVPVFSANDKNWVVTGARLVKRYNTIRIEIQQGILGKDGTIVNNIAAWVTQIYQKPIEEDVSRRLYHRIRWNGGRSINLKDIEAPKGHAVVALAFEYSDIYGLYLVIYSKSFNFTTGDLQGNNERTVPLLPTVNKLNLDDRDIPILSPRTSLTSETNKLAEFTTTGLKEDIGQTVIPFCDIQDVTTTMHTPMSGAGLYYKTFDKYGGYLGIKLYTYDIEPHVEYRPKNLEENK